MKKMSPFDYIAIIGFIAFCAVSIMRLIPDNKITNPQSTRSSDVLFDDQNYVYTCAQNKVKDMLKTPSNAKFPFESYKDVVTSIGDNNYLVSSHVDSQNSFGSMLRVNYICTVEFLSASIICNANCSLLEN